MPRIPMVLAVLVVAMTVFVSAEAVRLTHAQAKSSDSAAPAVPTPARSATPAPVPSATPAPEQTVTATAHPSFTSLETQVDKLLADAGASGAVTLIELGGTDPGGWNLNGDEQYTAASTYKQPLLMEEAQLVATGQAGPGDSLCYEDSDYEYGPYDDYVAGECFTRAELERRVGQDSDNTAAHILVRYDGGTDALNSYAAGHGATESAFFDPNSTTSNDLARLWQSEAEGQAGGSSAQAYLYPLLSHTDYEQGIPAGVPASVTVVHKVGFIGSLLHDSALVTSGPRGAYVLSILTDGGSWDLLSGISSAVWAFEATR